MKLHVSDFSCVTRFLIKHHSQLQRQWEDCSPQKSWSSLWLVLLGNAKNWAETHTCDSLKLCEQSIDCYFPNLN